MLIWTSGRGSTAIEKGAKDKNAVAILKEGIVVGHALYNMAPNLSQF